MRISTGIEPVRENRPPRVWLRVADNGGGVCAELNERIVRTWLETNFDGGRHARRVDKILRKEQDLRRQR